MQLTLSRPHSLAAALRRTPQPVRAVRDRTQRAGGPTEDRALYACSCGYAFKANVTTTVGCPECGRTQAW
jgi:hypothetical protein